MGVVRVSFVQSCEDGCSIQAVSVERGEEAEAGAWSGSAFGGWKTEEVSSPLPVPRFKYFYLL